MQNVGWEFNWGRKNKPEGHRIPVLVNRGPKRGFLRENVRMLSILNIHPGGFVGGTWGRYRVSILSILSIFSIRIFWLKG